MVPLIFQLPVRVWCNRRWEGFQAADINALFGFRLECVERLGEQGGVYAWSRFNALFNWLPLAALIEGRILCMHGGLLPFPTTCEPPGTLLAPQIVPQSFGLLVAGVIPGCRLDSSVSCWPIEGSELLVKWSEVSGPGKGVA